MSYVGSVPAGSELLVFARVSADGKRWGEWETAQPEATLRFDRVASYLQHRAVLLGNASTPRLESLRLEPLALSDQVAQFASAQNQVAPTYKLRATREGLVGRRTANGHVITHMDRFVSLPSWRSLSSRGGGEYMVRVTNPLNGKSAVAPVWDVGPWNRHDSYWNPVDREWYPDLPVGWSEDHAAYFDGYNNGRAEVGKVLWPSAIDVGDGTWVEDLGIKFHSEQGTLLITFLWLGSDPGPSPVPQEPGKSTPAPPPPPEKGAITVDDKSDRFFRSDNRWNQVSCGHEKHAWWTSTTTNEAKSTHDATWRPILPEDREYDVYAYVPYCRNGKADTREARYEVFHRDGVEVVAVNQAAKAGNWVKLGRWVFSSGDAGHVRLRDLAGDSKRSIWFDALKWVPVPPG